MFEQLLYFSAPGKDVGIICAIQGGHYLAYQSALTGEVIKRAPDTFTSLSQAKSWLKRLGIKTISLRQTPAYFEMIGFSK